jgi:CHASE2 domain-containing sensor protein
VSKRKKRHKTSKQASAAQRIPEATQAATRQIWLGFLVGLLVTALLIVGKIALEHSQFGQQIEHMTMVLQQLRLGEAVRGRHPDIVVVDITDVPQVPSGQPQDSDLVTRRDRLMEIVDAVAVRNPAAIGIDVIFGPNADGTMPDADRRFLNRISTLTDARGRRIQVFVAIFESVVRGPRRWLGEERFAEFAAYTLVPNPAQHTSTTNMIGGVELNVDGEAVRCRSLADAVAHAGKRHEIERRWLGRKLHDMFSSLLERDLLTRGEHFTADEFTVDFGALSALRASAIVAARPDDIARANRDLHDKVVFIGRGQTGRTTDVFTVPGESTPVPGVFVHASAAYTLMEAPLYRLTHVGRIVADVLAALIPLGCVLLVRLRHIRRSPSEAAAQRLFTRVAFLTAGLAFVFGYIVFERTGILWTDYLMVIAALLLHGPLEHAAAKAVARMRGVPSAEGRVIAGAGHE